jgi:hypothetical protein
MRFTKWKAAGVAAGTAAFALLGGPAHAAVTGTHDSIGVDYDPACVASVAVTPPPANSIQSPNGGGGAGCPDVTSYDGSMRLIDIHDGMVYCPPPHLLTLSLCLANSPTQLSAGIVTWAHLPSAGSTASADLPSAAFTGASFINMFQNKTVQTYVPTNPVGGCTRTGVGNQVLDQYASWKDGSHFFTAYNINFIGGKWVHSVQVGEYDPRPQGGFQFFELGTNDGTGWSNANPYMVKGVNWDVVVTTSGGGDAITIQFDGVFKTPDSANCQEGYFKHAFAKTGDTIANAKGMTTANEVVTLPVTVPLSGLCEATSGAVCEDDLTTVGGFVFYADTTDGNSTAGLLNTNITGIAYTPGAVGVSDTLGDGPTCPTPTFGGLLPPNPLFVPDTACQIDDNIARGSFLSEWWDTAYGFTF